MFRAAGSTFDCGALWKLLAARAGSRGGGRALANAPEGRITSVVDDWPALIAELGGADSS